MSSLANIALNLLAIAICVMAVISDKNVLSVTSVTNQLPSITPPNVVGPCAAFTTVNISADDLIGTFYIVKSTFPGNEATYTCASYSIQPSGGSVVHLQSNQTIFSMARTNPQTIYWTWTTPFLGISTAIVTNDVTSLSWLSFVAYKKGFGVVVAICPQVTSCGLDCGSYVLRVAVKNRNANPDDVNKYLIQPLLSNYVPIGNLVNVSQDNCHLNPPYSLTGQLPLDL